MYPQEMYEQQTQCLIPTIGILPNDDERLRTVMMTNITRDTTLPELKSWLVEKTGIAVRNIRNIQIREPYNKEKPTVLAEIIFDSTRATDQCIANLYKFDERERQLKENTMNMHRAIPEFIKKNTRHKESKMAQTRKLFVSCLPKEGYNLEQELTKYIGSLVDSEETQILGEIKKYHVIMEKDPLTNEPIDGLPKGIAFIYVSSEHLADKLAIQCGGGFEIGGRRIDFKKSVDNEARNVPGRGIRPHGPLRGAFHARGGSGGFAARGARGGVVPRGARGAFPARGASGGFAARGARGGFPAPPQWAAPPQQGHSGWDIPSSQKAYAGHGQQARGGYQQVYGEYY